jgi:hypothetical protein
MTNVSLSQTKRILRTALAAGLALVLVALAPGLAPYEAAAQVFNGAMGAAGRSPSAPVVAPIGAPNAGGVSVVPSFTQFAPSLAPGLTFAPAPSVSAGLTAAPFSANQPAAAPAFAHSGVFPVLPVSALLGAPSAAPSASPIALAASNAAVERAAALRTSPAASVADGAPVTARGQLAQTASALDSARGEGEKTGFLNTLFTGARNFFGLSEPASIAASAAVSEKIAPSSAFAALTPASLGLARAAASAPEQAKPASGESRATPPAPVVQVSDGLNPGQKLLSDAAAAQAAPAAPQAPKGDDWIDNKAVKWMMIQGAISIVGFIATSVAYPLVAISALHAVAIAGGIAAGAAGAYAIAKFGGLMSIGPLASIATGPLNGLIADRLSPRNGLVLLAIIRGALALALPAFAWLGMLNFWTLLVASIANGWQLSMLMTSEGAYYRKLAGRNQIEKIQTIAALRYLFLQVVLGLIVGIGAVIDHWNPMTPFVVSALLHFFVVAPLIWFKIPNIVPVVKAKAQAAARSSKERARAIVAAAKAFFKKYWKEILMFGAAAALYQFGLPFALGGLVAAGFGQGSTLALAASLLLWVVRTDGFKAVWAQKNLRAVMLLTAVSFGLIYPFQYLGLPLMASIIGGAAGKGLVYGQLLGALFFGQLLANAASPKIKELGGLRIPFTNRTIGVDRLVHGAALALGATWTVLRLFPGNWLAAGAAVAIGAILMWAASKFTARGWIKYLGLGLAAVTLTPLFFLGTLPAVFAAMMAFGFFVGPASVALNAYFGKNAREANIGNAYGASSSLNNAATSFGYGVIGGLVGLFHPAFPGALGPIAGIFIAIGVIFFMFGPRLLPGLPDKSFASQAKPAEPKPVEKK